jgi:hemolysin III
VLLLPPDRRTLLLCIVWTGALTGIAFRVLWVNAPRWLYTPCYLALGWAPVRCLPDFLHTGGAAVVTLTVTGGLLYSAGAVVYAVQRSDPSPRWFGFHEVFHALTVAAFTAHCIALAVHWRWGRSDTKTISARSSPATRGCDSPPIPAGPLSSGGE